MFRTSKKSFLSEIEQLLDIRYTVDPTLFLFHSPKYSFIEILILGTTVRKDSSICGSSTSYLKTIHKATLSQVINLFSAFVLRIFSFEVISC